MSLVVASQDEAGRAHRLHEVAVDAIDKAWRVEIAAEGVEHRLGGLRVVFERLGPCVEPGGTARCHRADTADRLRQHSTLHALGLGLDKIEDERATDALAVAMPAIDAQMVE